MSELRRWTGPALFMIGVLLFGVGIAGMLRVSYIQHPSWTLVILPPVGTLAGCALLLFPLLRRLSSEAGKEDEPPASHGAGPNRRPQSR
ncbi:MAG TPA: hypothetical protein VNJ12_08875 [Candidatus Dormibacteraeota bacterium]|nr:hypothetical protein [Candidatus Dormibacteraeota bacterium]